MGTVRIIARVLDHHGPGGHGAGRPSFTVIGAGAVQSPLADREAHPLAIGQQAVDALGHTTGHQGLHRRPGCRGGAGAGGEAGA